MSHSRRDLKERSQDSLNSDGGIVADSLDLILIYCNEWTFAVPKNEGVALGDEVWELRQRINMWKAGEQNLDLRLARAPQLRRAVLRILMPCIWELRQGEIWFDRLEFYC